MDSPFFLVVLIDHMVECNIKNIRELKDNGK